MRPELLSFYTYGRSCPFSFSKSKKNKAAGLILAIYCFFQIKTYFKFEQHNGFSRATLLRDRFFNKLVQVRYMKY